MKKAIFIVVSLIGVMVALYIIFARPFIHKKMEVERELEEALEKVKRCYSSPEGPPSEELIKELEKGNKLLEDEYIKVRRALYKEFKVEIPKEQNPALYFMELYYHKKKEWQEYAALKSASIPTEIEGLPERLPSEQEVPILLKKMDCVDWIIHKILDAGVESIGEIAIYNPEEKGIYTKIPLTIALTCDLLAFSKLLNMLENEKERFIMIDDLSLEAKVIEKIIPLKERRPSREALTTASERELYEIPTKTITKEVIYISLSLSILEWSKI